MSTSLAPSPAPSQPVSDTFRDTYWKHQIKLKRRLTTIKDDGLRQVYCDQLAAHAIPVDTFIDRFNADPLATMQARLESGTNQPGLAPPSTDPADYPISPDLILAEPPFSLQWAQEQGDPDWKSDPDNKKNAVGTRWAPYPNDTSEIGAEVRKDGRVYEKRLMVVEGGTFLTSVADPAAGGTPWWFRVS